MVALLPGNLVAPPAIERLLWSTRLSVEVIAVTDLLASVLVNGVCFISLLFALRRWQSHGA